VSKSVDFTGTINEAQGFRNYLEEKTTKLPPNTLNIGDRDDSDYDENLLDQKKIDSDGFPIESQDWQRPGEDDDGESYVQYLFEIDGAKWIDKYDFSNSQVYNSAVASGNTGVNVLAAVGLLNTIGVVWVWFKFLNTLTNSNYWITWLSVLLVNGTLWIPITLSWPVSPFGGLTFVLLMKTFAQMTLIGAFGAYWFNFAAMVYTFYITPEESESLLTGSEPLLYLGGYTALSALNSALSLLFIGDIIAWYETEVAVLALAEE